MPWINLAVSNPRTPHDCNALLTLCLLEYGCTSSGVQDCSARAQRGNTASCYHVERVPILGRDRIGWLLKDYPLMLSTMDAEVDVEIDTLAVISKVAV